MESEEHVEYREGLIAVGGSIGMAFFLWASILLILRCAGKSAGCAAGFPFHMSEEAVTKEYESRRDIENGDNEPIPSDEMENYADSYQDKSYLSNREKRTRICFLFFAVITILCVPPTIILVVEPLKTTTHDSDALVLTADEIIGELNNALTTSTSSLEAAALISEETPTEFTEICQNTGNETILAPELTEEERNALQFAKVSLREMHNLILDELNETQDLASSETRGAERFTSRFKKLYKYAESTQSEIKTYVWVLPFLLLGIVSAAVVMIYGVIHAMKRKTSENFRKGMSYVVLPILLFCTASACVIAIAGAVTVVIADDACNGGTQDGTPRDTIMSVLEVFEIEPSEALFTYTASLTGECANGGPDPTLRLQSVENAVQESINVVWEKLAEIDAVEQSLLASVCETETSTIEKFISDSRKMAMFLTNIRRALESLSGSLTCDRVYPLYVESIEDTMCTDVAQALAWALIFFLLLGLSTMCLVTLRASWQFEQAEDEIYSEDEEIENMFVDEHEEYLAYISRFKHEWEEYEGTEEDEKQMAPHTLYPAGFGATYGTGSRTHSDTDSGEGRVNSEDVFEDEHFFNFGSRGTHIDTQDDREEGPFDSGHTQAYSPMTIESEITFMSLRDQSLPTHQPQASALGEDPVSSPLLVANSRDPIDFGHDEFVSQLTMVLEEQNSRDLDVVQQLSRDIDRQNTNELRVMKELAAPESERAFPLAATRVASVDEEKEESNDDNDRYDTGLPGSPETVVLLSSKSKESVFYDDEEMSHCDEPMRLESEHEHDRAHTTTPTFDEDLPSHPYVPGSAETESVVPEVEIGVTKRHFFDDEVPSSPTSDAESVNEIIDEDALETRRSEDPEGAVAESMAIVSTEHGPSFEEYQQAIVPVPSREVFVDEQPPDPVESFDPPSPMESFEAERLALEPEALEPEALEPEDAPVLRQMSGSSPV